MSENSNDQWLGRRWYSWRWGLYGVARNVPITLLWWIFQIIIISFLLNLGQYFEQIEGKKKGALHMQRAIPELYTDGEMLLL